MAKTNWATIGLGAAALGAVWFATRKKPAAEQPPDDDDGLGGGYPPGPDGPPTTPTIPAQVYELQGCIDPAGIYTDADGDKVLAVVRKWVKRHPVKWSKPGDIVQPARDAARHVFKTLCPGMLFPAVGEDYKIDNYAATQGAAWANLYDMAFQFAYDMILDADF